LRKGICIALTFAILFTLLIPQFTIFAAPTHNYAEALQKAIYFYECQQAGPLPEWNRVEWRGDATMNDYIKGGWYDAGDHVKFNLPMSYTASMLGWALYEYGSGIEASGQKIHLERNLKFALDYLAACDLGDKVVYQIGDGNADHKWWGPAEVIELEMERPYYTCKASCVTGQMAAALAIGSIVLKDSSYLAHAKSLFSLADKTKSDSDYTKAKGFYDSWSGFYDELAWAAVWLYIATNDKTYLDKAESYVPNFGREDQSTIMKYRWGHCWDDVHYGAMLLLAKLTDKQEYHDFVKMHLDWWTVGYNGQKIDYTSGGLAWMYQWGSLRHSTTTAFLASVYADSIKDSTLKTRYSDFAKQQIDYALGSNPNKRSYVVGFGNNPPEHPHHRTAHGSWSDQDINPANHRHILYGALVGGPQSASDSSYEDTVKNYQCNEVATDYNAGFVGILCKMVSRYGGTTLSNFPAKETREDEFYVEACVNQEGSNYTEIKALLNNHSGWPARVIKDFSYNYYIDISEVIEAGYSAKDLTVKKGYDEFSDTKVSELINYSGNIYYVKVSYPDGSVIAPIGQEQNNGEIQFRISAPEGTSFWDSSNDFSREGLVKQDVKKTKNIPVYDGNELIYGTEPEGGPSISPSPSSPVGMKGDLNDDGKINSTDYALLKRLILGIVEASDLPNGSVVADLNSDGRINSTDYALMKRYILGTITEF